MRRPDLPLILLVMAIALAVTLLNDPLPEPAIPDGGTPGEQAANPVDEYFADLDPAVLRCLAAESEPAEGGNGGARSPAASVQRVSDEVERVRQLRFARPVQASFLSGPQVRDTISELLAEEIPPAELAKEGEVLELLGAIPAGSDLYEITEDALGSQVAGLYDTKSKELLVRGSQDLGPDELITLAHELVHALTDQRLELREHVGGKEAADRELAYASVVEGDATLAMLRYTLAHIDISDQLSLGETFAGEEAFDRLPDYVQRTLLFPYLEGLRLVCHRWVAGGWKAVNGLYERPPASTDEVLFPQRYGDGPPTDPAGPPAPGPGWASRSKRELGAAELEWLFAAPAGDTGVALPETRALVSSWTGGELELWANGPDRALAIALAERPGRGVLCGALAAWYERGWPEAETAGDDSGALTFAAPGRYAAVKCAGGEVRMGLAPDLKTAVTLAG